MTLIETGRSVFDGRQEEIVDPKTGHIILDSKLAEKILFDFLLSEYMTRVKRDERYELYDPCDPEVKVLAQIVKAKEGERIDFTEALEEFKKKTEEEFKAEQERKYGKGGTNIIRPTPRVREI